MLFNLYNLYKYIILNIIYDIYHISYYDIYHIISDIYYIYHIIYDIYHISHIIYVHMHVCINYIHVFLLKYLRISFSSHGSPSLDIATYVS